MSARRRIILGLEVLAVILVVGTAGFIIIDGAPAFDALYMVVITITTVGFGEVFELSILGRAWAMVIMVSGFGVAFYTAIAALEYLIDLNQVRHQARMQRQIDQLQEHVIVCGFGRVGRSTHAALVETGGDVVVVDWEPVRIDRALEVGALVVPGDATHNETLIQAGVERASAVIACVDNDSDNLVIALSAKSIRPDLRVICRATEPESERKLRLAGADGVVTPQAVGAERLAALAVQPELSQIFDVVVNGRPVEFHVEEVDIRPGSPIDGLTLADSGIRQTSGAMVLAVEAQKVSMRVNPGPDLELRAGDRLVLVGTKEQVDKAADMLAPV